MSDTDEGLKLSGGVGRRGSKKNLVCGGCEGKILCVERARVKDRRREKVYDTGERLKF